MSPRGAPAHRRGPEYYWEQAKRFGDAGFTVAELHARTRGVSLITVRSYIDTLRSLGLVETLGPSPVRLRGQRARFVYRVTKPLPTAPMASALRPGDTRGAIQRNLWTAMRTLPMFEISELAVIASTEEVLVSAATAQTYVLRLVAAGLCAVVQPSRPLKGERRGRTPAVYRLLPSASTGPSPLSIIGNRVFDPNGRAFVGRPLDAARQDRTVAVSA